MVYKRLRRLLNLVIRLFNLVILSEVRLQPNAVEGPRGSLTSNVSWHFRLGTPGYTSSRPEPALSGVEGGLRVFQRPPDLKNILNLRQAHPLCSFVPLVVDLPVIASFASKAFLSALCAVSLRPLR